MKTFPRGRIGNNLFQYAFIRALSERHGIKWALPLWSGSKFFHMGRNWSIDENIPVDVNKREFGFDYDPQFANRESCDFTKNINFIGYFQSEKYFADAWDKIKDDFRFEKSYRIKFMDFQPDKKDVAVHVRRGDYVSNQNYILLSSKYYIDYFNKHPKKTFYIFSDDYDYCKKHFVQKNVVFMDGHSAIDHLCMMSKFTNLFIANSSFSWWAAKLAELYNGDVNVIRPDRLFAVRLKRENGKDFYPDRWKCKEVKYLGAKKATFIIPICFDSRDRRENLEIIVWYLKHYFNASIILGEQGSGTYFKYMSEKVKYVIFPYKKWHRTKMLNEMTKMAETPFVVSIDADVFVQPGQIISAVEELENGADIVYPYDGTFVLVDRKWVKVLGRDITELERFDGIAEDMKLFDKVGYGGIYCYNKESFIKAGMENENMISHSPEDIERYLRFTKLGLIIKRVKGCAYHLQHFLSDNSKQNNEFKDDNFAEYRKIKEMSDSDLKKYINSWLWIK